MQSAGNAGCGRGPAAGPRRSAGAHTGGGLTPRLLSPCLLGSEMVKLRIFKPDDARKRMFANVHGRFTGLDVHVFVAKIVAFLF